jgi:hypothetical protein
MKTQQQARLPGAPVVDVWRRSFLPVLAVVVTLVLALILAVVLALVRRL